MLTIINYGVGNLQSIKNMLKKVGCSEAIVSADPHIIALADKLILPGVGHYDYGMQQLHASGLIDVLQKRVQEDKIPILGICLGLQLLTKGSEEGSEPGLGWIDAYTRRFRSEEMDAALKVPHMGWGEVLTQKASLLLEDLPTDPRFYFVHTYHLVCSDSSDELVSCHYGYDFTAGVERGNVLGVQFHPEKSHKYGMALLKNFINNY